MNEEQGNGLSWIQREMRVVQLLFDISQSLNRSLRIEECLQPILGRMAEQVGMVRGFIAIMNRETNEKDLQIVYGLTSEDGAKNRCRLVKRVTEKVIETGTPAIVEKASGEPRYLDQAWLQKKGWNRNDIAFICVPIHNSTGIIGAIGADRLFANEFSIDEDVHLLTIVSSLLAEAIEIRWEVRERERVLQEEKERLQRELLDHFKSNKIIGNSRAISQVQRLIKQVSSSRAHVLITGESGVGKELVAEEIHVNSSRACKPFIRVNLAALPHNMIESELFGHERDAFAGAASMRKGSLEAADKGTLFLDEIGILPLATQAKLLRVLQEKESERLGGDATINVDVRIIAATDRNLEKSIQNFQFRLDLYFRLNVFPIFVPPLRERKTDISLLADYFVERAGKKHDKTIRRISIAAIDRMMRYEWPGNVRELENCIERAVLLSTDGVIHGHHLPLSLQTPEGTGAHPPCNLQAF